MKRGLGMMLNAVDENMERSIATHNPRDAGAFPEARRDYKAALAVEDASKSSRSAGSFNYITPASIESAASKIYGQRAHERGYDPFDWAPAAKAVLKTEASSNTARRAEIRQAIKERASRAAALIGFGAGMHSGPENLSMIAGPVGGLLAGERLGEYATKPIQQAAEAYARTRLGQAHIGNQLLAGAPGVDSLPGLLSAARAGGVSQ